MRCVCVVCVIVEMCVVVERGVAVWMAVDRCVMMWVVCVVVESGPSGVDGCREVFGDVSGLCCCREWA